MSVMRDLATVRILVVCVLATGCAANKADTTAANAIQTVRVTTNIGDVRDCRIIRHVDSRDTALGCGQSTQSTTPEECLRFQVRRAGGDTLLMRGPAGEAYDCGSIEAPAVAAQEPSPAPKVGTKTSTSASPQAPTNAATTTPIPERVAAPTVPAAAPEMTPSVRVTTDRSSARGCVYLGDLDWTAACGVTAGAAMGPCADTARRLGGNLIVRDGARVDAFWCRPTP
jgi:hypothetical protein